MTFIGYSQYLLILLVRYTVIHHGGIHAVIDDSSQQEDLTASEVQFRLIRFPAALFVNDLLGVVHDLIEKATWN